jgi:cell division transport system permease protein
MTEHINFNEPPSGIASGVLTEIWNNPVPVPKIRGMELVIYYLQRGFSTAIQLPMSSAITVITMALSLFMLAGLLLTLQNIDAVLSAAGTSLSLTAYIKTDADPAVVKEALRAVENHRRVRSANYVSQAEALQNFRRDLGSRNAFLEGLELNNPLPASIDIVLRPDDEGLPGLEKFAVWLRSQKVVDEVVYGSEWVDKMQGVMRVFRAVSLISLLLAMSVVVFLISNTIKLVIYARRAEIGIMQLVGASETFIRIPFMISGVLQGVLGSVLALIALKAGFTLINVQLKNSTIFGVALPHLEFLTFPVVSGLIVVGVVVGAIGSFFALGRFLNV